MAQLLNDLDQLRQNMSKKRQKQGRWKPVSKKYAKALLGNGKMFIGFVFWREHKPAYAQPVFSNDPVNTRSRRPS